MWFFGHTVVCYDLKLELYTLSDEIYSLEYLFSMVLSISFWKSRCHFLKYFCLQNYPISYFFYVFYQIEYVIGLNKTKWPCQNIYIWKFLFLFSSEDCFVITYSIRVLILSTLWHNKCKFTFRAQTFALCCSFIQTKEDMVEK